jgi:hypothetical protein
MCLTIFQILSLCKNLWDWLHAKGCSPLLSLFLLADSVQTLLFPMGLNEEKWQVQIIHLLAQVALFNYPQKQNDNNQVGDPIANTYTTTFDGLGKIWPLLLS